MIDRSVIRTMLQILDQLNGVSIERQVFFNETAMKAPYAVTSDDLRENLAECLSHGWMEKLAGPLGEERFCRTASGGAVLRELGGH